MNAASIIDALWPEHDLGKAKSYLYTCLSYLRRSLAENGIAVQISKGDQGFAAEVGDLVVDSVQFRKLLDGFSSLVDEARDEKAYRQLIELYRGDYMESCDYGWAAAKQLELKSLYVGVLRGWSRHFLGRGNSGLAIDGLQRLLSLVPESEADGRELIRIHLKLGNRNEAHRVRMQVEQAVRVQLGTELEEETLTMFRQIVEKAERRFR